MKRIKSGIFDSISINDMNLVLKKEEVVEVPDDVFALSADLKKAISRGFVICEGVPHKGTIPKFGRSREFLVQKTSSAEDTLQNVNNRLCILEKSVSLLMSRDYEMQAPKYMDHLIYANTFSSSEYDALLFDAFTDSSKRHSSLPGDAVIRNSNLFSDNNSLFTIFNSQDFEIEQPVSEIFAMARWTGTGVVRMYVKTGKEEIQVLGESMNKLWAPIAVEKSNTISVTIVIKASYNSSVELNSYGILIKF